MIIEKRRWFGANFFRSATKQKFVDENFIFVKRNENKKKISRSCSFLHSVIHTGLIRNPPDTRTSTHVEFEAEGHDEEGEPKTMPKCLTRTERDIMSTQSVDAKTSPSVEKQKIIAEQHMLTFNSPFV